MEPIAGLEPATSSLPRKCSTTELYGLDSKRDPSNRLASWSQARGHLTSFASSFVTHVTHLKAQVAQKLLVEIFPDKTNFIICQSICVIDEPTNIEVATSDHARGLALLIRDQLAFCLNLLLLRRHQLALRHREILRFHLCLAL